MVVKFQRAPRRAAMAVLGVAVAGVIGGAGVAGAAPTPPPPPAKAFGTSCTVKQVEKALSVQDPALWRQLQTHPRAKAMFEKMIVMSPAQRMHWREEQRRQHPERSALMTFLADHGVGKVQRERDHAAIEKALHTCSRF